MPHGLEQLLELFVHRPGEVATSLRRQHVHQPALDPALLALGGLEPIYRLVKLASALVNERRETLYLIVLSEVVCGCPGVVAGGADGLMSILRPNDRLLLLLPLALSLPQLPLQRFYGGRQNETFPVSPTL